MYYVYLYLREDRTPYYVGKGSGKRINQRHRLNGGKFLPLPPLDRRVIIKYFDYEDECFLFEEWLIEFYGRKIDGGILIEKNIMKKIKKKLLPAKKDIGRIIKKD